MTDESSTGASSCRDAETDAASNAYWRMCQAAIQIAEAAGADVHERPMFPGAISVSRYAEPLAGIRAAKILADTAARIRGEYVARARAEGIAWPQIGQALGLDQGRMASPATASVSPRSSTSRVRLTCGASPASATTSRRAASGSPTADHTRTTHQTAKAVTPTIAPGSPPS